MKRYPIISSCYATGLAMHHDALFYTVFFSQLIAHKIIFYAHVSAGFDNWLQTTLINVQKVDAQDGCQRISVSGLPSPHYRYISSCISLLFGRYGR